MESQADARDLNFKRNEQEKSLNLLKIKGNAFPQVYDDDHNDRKLRSLAQLQQKGTLTYVVSFHT
jgi:hypothetical protein